MADHLSTQNPVDVAIDEACRQATSSAQWLIERNKDVKTYYGNSLEFFICGQEGFQDIATQLTAAKESVEIICWGFDPGMELVRSGRQWPRGTTYGDLLEQLAKRGVKVRLLVWFNAAGSVLQNNMPGYTDASAGPLGSPYQSSKRQQYCMDWWSRYLPYGSGTSANPNLQVVLRDVSIGDARAGLADEKDKPSGLEIPTLEGFGTHHQKPILIDYAYDGGSKAVGYIMGLNSVTDFWDTTAHEIDDPLRELWTSKSVGKEIDHETATEGKVSKARYRQAKPYQDYACRLVGPALERVHQNFVRAWNRDAPAAWHLTELGSPPPKLPKQPFDPARAVQVVRTQPHEKEKSIKDVYLQAASYGRNYIYIENQYFFYPTFARSLKEHRLNFCRRYCRGTGKSMAEVPKLYLFIVLPNPEQDGMVPRTFDTMSLLGASDTMPDQGKYVDAGDASQNYGESKNASYSITVPDEWGRNITVTEQHKVLDRPTMSELERTYGLEISVGRLRTSGLDANNQMAYREVYIHAKLMLIDDVFVTVGSANLNQRSMAVDSEINIAATEPAKVSSLRRRVFELNSGGATSGANERGEVPDVFKRWQQQMKDNKDLRMSAKNMNGFILPFEDHRATATMVASVSVPSANDVG